jgi:hypothetical protein
VNKKKERWSKMYRTQRKDRIRRGVLQQSPVFNTGKRRGGKLFAIYFPSVSNAKFILLHGISEEVMPQRKCKDRTAK